MGMGKWMVRGLAAVSAVTLLGVAGWVLAVVIPAGCAGTPNLTPTIQGSHQRSLQLLGLAAREAGFVKNLNARLTRQLNIANRQFKAGDTPGSARTLGEAAGTLRLPEAAKEMTEHTRISGWVSISELSRQANDKALAEKACTQAVDVLHAIVSKPARCQYVMGVANELHQLRGPKPAAGLLEEGGQWAKEIGDLNAKRGALVAFAVALFNIDEYEVGLKVLQNEDDPAWRSDKLLELSQAEREGKSRLMRSWGSDVGYRKVFDGNSMPQVPTSQGMPEK